MTTEMLDAPEIETPTAIDTSVTPEIAAETPPATEGEPVDPEAVPETDKPKPDGVQKRISELTRARRDAERRADAAERQLAAMAHNKAPTEDQFDDHDAFVKALTKHEVKTAVAETVRETSAQAVQEARQEAWKEQIGAFRASTTDYDTVVAASEDLQIASHVGSALMDSEHGAALLYEMAKDNSLAERLNSMSPTRAAMEIGRLEATLGAKAAKPPSKAPDPITPLTATRAAPSTKLEAMSMDDYIAARNKQGAGFRR